MGSQDPTIEDFARAVVAKALSQVRTAIPAVVLDYDRTTQRARVRPTVTVPTRDPATGIVEAYIQPPAVSNVPVQWSGGSGGVLTFDLEVGDVGVLLVCDRGIARWKSTGNESNDPADSRRMDLSDGIFIPGITSGASPLPATATANGAAVLYGSDVRLGSADAVDPVALAPNIETQLDTLKTAITNAVIVPGDGGASFKSTLLAGLIGWPNVQGATKVAAE